MVEGEVSPRASHLARCCRLLALAAVAASLALALGVRARREERVPENLLILSLDTLRADHLGVYGYERPTSPRIDAFARRSSVFRRAVSQSNSTKPSHGSLLTSLYPSALGASLGPVPPWADTLAEILRENGFATWGFVDGGYVRKEFGFAQGFDLYDDRPHRAAKILRRAAAWITHHPGSRFFLFLHCYDVHTPYDAPPEYVALFGSPEYLGGRFAPGQEYFLAHREKRHEPSEEEVREIVARYDAGIRQVDDEVGEFLDWFESEGYLDDTLVVILSDHGEEFLEHGMFEHRQLYLSPNLHVPLMVFEPGEPGRTIEKTVELVDVVPTVLSLLGISAAHGGVGESLVPLLRGRDATDGIAYAELTGAGGWHTVVDGQYQYMEGGRPLETRLFDLSVDPEATRNVVEDAPEVAARLRAELRSRKRAAGSRYRAHSRRAAVPLRIDDGVRRELEALGYVEPAR